MADLVTRLLLKNEQFNSAINASAGQVRKFEHRTSSAGAGVGNFQDKIGKLAGTAGTSLIKFAGYAGLAVGGVEALEKTMRGSQTTSDAFDNTINAAKNSVDLFFTSLSRGDWAPFQSGILDTFRSLKELSAIMDELADKKLSLSVIKADKLSDIEKYEEIARDTNNTLEERTEAVKKLHAAINDLNAKTKETIDFEMNALLKSYNISSGLNFTRDDIKEFAVSTNFTGSATAEANAAYKEFLRLKNELDEARKVNQNYAKQYGWRAENKTQINYNEINARYNAYVKENEELIKQGWLTEEGDEKRKATLQTLIEQYNVQREISTLEKRANRTERSVNTAIKSQQNESAIAAKEKEKTIKIIDDLSIKAQNEIESEFARIVSLWDEKNTELAKKNPFAPVLGFTGDEEEQDITGSVKDIEEQIQTVTLAYNEATTNALRALYADRKTELEKHLAEITDINQGMIDITDEMNSMIQNGIVNAFSTIGDAIGSGNPGEAMKRMLLGMMDLLQQFGAALIAAGMAKIAFDKLLSNPYAAIAAGSALVIAVSIAKSAINSIHDFDEGGVVYGETFARVGEYAGASTNPEVIAPLNKLRDILKGDDDNNNQGSYDVSFRVKGEDLVAVLNKYNRRIRRTE